MTIKKIRTTAEYLLLVLISGIFILPVLFLVLQSLIGLSGAISGNNYLQVLGKSRNIQAFAMGLKISTVAGLITVTLALSSALVLSRNSGKRSIQILSLILVLSGLPFCTLVIPLYFVLFTLKLLDSLPITILFLAAANIPLNIWILKQYIDTIPTEMKETAKLEGSTEAIFFIRILLPQLLPVLTGSFITTFLNCWGNFIVPFILLSSSTKLPAGLAFFQVFSTGDPSMYGYLSAYAVLYFIPVIGLYLILRLGMPRLFVLQRLKA